MQSLVLPLFSLRKLCCIQVFNVAGFNAGQRCVEEGFGAQVDLGVFGVAVEVEIEVAEDLTKEEDVDDEE